jgi:hypothetical protein
MESAVLIRFRKVFEPWHPAEEIMEILAIEEGGWVVLTRFPDSPMRRIYLVDGIGDYVPKNMPTNLIVLQHAGFPFPEEQWRIVSSWAGSILSITISRDDKISVDRITA